MNLLNLINAIQAWARETKRGGSSVHVAVEHGYDDVTEPDEVFRRTVPNDTFTVTIRINGGARFPASEYSGTIPPDRL